MRVRLEWKPQDCWIGAYWKRDLYALHVWICLLPMLPIHIIKPIPASQIPTKQGLATGLIRYEVEWIKKEQEGKE